MRDGRRPPAARWQGLAAAVGLVAVLAGACGGASARPGGIPLSPGRWTDGAVCLAVAADESELIAGCGHGRFATPLVRNDGTFAVEGTYRIEAGPVGIEPAPPAAFSGRVKGHTLTLAVTPSDPSISPGSWVLQWTSAAGACAVRCL